MKDQKRLSLSKALFRNQFDIQGLDFQKDRDPLQVPKWKGYETREIDIRAGMKFRK